MKKHYHSLDFLRGIGIFFVLILHTAFYYYQDIYDVDLNNPAPIITLIGFLLMFAGLFAMVSGVSHTVSSLNHLEEKKNKRLKYMIYQGLMILVIAYLYFIFTGPGIIHFDTRSMDESLFVSLINHGNFQGLTFDRIMYIDSLVMIGFNVIFIALLLRVFKKHLKKPNTHIIILIIATVFIIISYIRIPLYDIYLNAREQKNYPIIFLLNWFVNKNNPIFPYLSFGIFGIWIGLLLKHQSKKGLIKWILPVSVVYLIVGVLGYILTPETMLERAIDPTWYFIMVIQIGLFLLMTLGAILVFDFGKEKNNLIIRFIKRFGVAGLTPFFLESIVSALIFMGLNWIMPINFNIPGALIYGLLLAILWGVWLWYWEKKQYRYGLEWVMTSLLSRVSKSSKLEKLKGN